MSTHFSCVLKQTRVIAASAMILMIFYFCFACHRICTGSCEPTLLVGDNVLINKIIYWFYAPQRGEIVACNDPESKKSLHIKRIIGLPGDTIEGRLEEGRPTIYLNGIKLNEPYLNCYPLIKLKKEVGLIPIKRWWRVTIPDILRKKSKYVFCSFDPSKPYIHQPYYSLSKNEIVLHPITQQPQMRQPHTPSSSIDFDNASFLASVDNFGPYRIPEGNYWVMGDNRLNSRDSRYWGYLPREFIRGRVTCILSSVDSFNTMWLFDFARYPITFITTKIRWSRFCMRIQ